MYKLGKTWGRDVGKSGARNKPVAGAERMAVPLAFMSTLLNTQ